jgi:hypothetical protein
VRKGILTARSRCARNGDKRSVIAGGNRTNVICVQPDWDTGKGPALIVMSEGERLRALAERCTQLAKQCASPSVAEALTGLATEYFKKASELTDAARHQSRKHD